ncbi:MAG: hypothetical protein ACREBU_16520 [Nitrososphaera sp.]
MPDAVVSSMAEGLARVFAHYDGQERQFMEDLLHIWCQIDRFGNSSAERFRRLYRDERLDRFPAYKPDQGRPRPKPFEASIETCRRLMDLNRVRDALAPLQTGGILGGSVSYGRFFNTCGATTREASDTDLLLVIPDYDVLTKVAAALNSVKGLDKESLEVFRRRTKSFNSARKFYRRCILSHKLKFWEDRKDPYLSQYQIPGNYLLSLHIFSQRDFEYMIVKDKPILEAGPRDKFERAIWDYRDTLPTRPDNQLSFSGVDIGVPPKVREVTNGFLSLVRVCHIQDNRFFPGLHQNLILPQFEIRWEAPGKRLYLPVLGFRWKILERLREEQRLRPFEVQKVSQSHTRSPVFAPHITRRADRE